MSPSQKASCRVLGEQSNDAKLKLEKVLDSGTFGPNNVAPFSQRFFNLQLVSLEQTPLTLKRFIGAGATRRQSDPRRQICPLCVNEIDAGVVGCVGNDAAAPLQYSNSRKRSLRDASADRQMFPESIESKELELNLSESKWTEPCARCHPSPGLFECDDCAAARTQCFHASP